MLNVRQRRAAQARQYILDKIEQIGEGFISQWLDVHVSTVRRWAEGKAKVPRAAITAIEAHLGRLPGMDTREWERWTIDRRDGKLYSPDGVGRSTGNIMAQRYERALIAAQRNKIRELEAKLAKATVGGLSSANDGDLSVHITDGIATGRSTQ